MRMPRSLIKSGNKELTTKKPTVSNTNFTKNVVRFSSLWLGCIGQPRPTLADPGVVPYMGSVEPPFYVKPIMFVTLSRMKLIE